jgi:hypothetical protein
VLKRPVSGENTAAPALPETVTDITSANHMRVGAVRPAWDTVGEFDGGRRMTLRGAAADRSSGLRWVLAAGPRNGKVLQASDDPVPDDLPEAGAPLMLIG